MSAPERIWVDFFDTDFEGITCMDVAGVPFLSAIEYVRADTVAPQVAAARAEALREALAALRAIAPPQDFANSTEARGWGKGVKQSLAAIRALIPEAKP